MTRKFTYEIILKVQHEGLLTLPVADFHVQGTLDADKDFRQQLGDTCTRCLARIRPKLEKARGDDRRCVSLPPC
jgi:hypothetical protein